MQKIISANVEMTDDGEYHLTVVDFLNDTTHSGPLPDHIVGMLPMILTQIRNQLDE